MKFLNDLLRETRQIYEQASAKNLFPSEVSREISTELASFEQGRDSLRARTYNATTVIHEFPGLFNGLSLRIMKLSYHVKKLRARLHSERINGSQTSIDALDLESGHSTSSQQYGGSLDPRQPEHQSASSRNAPSKFPDRAVSEVSVEPGDSHHQVNDAPSVGAPLSASEGIPPLFPPVAASPPHLLRYLHRFREWMLAPRVRYTVPEIPNPNRDIAIRLPRVRSSIYTSLFNDPAFSEFLSSRSTTPQDNDHVHAAEGA